MTTTLACPCPSLALLLKSEPGGPTLHREQVGALDLVELRGELWFHACLRKGFAGLPLEDVAADVIPESSTDSAARCVGFWLQATLPDSRRVRRHFSLTSLAPIARRTAKNLRESGVLPQEGKYYYAVEVDDATPRPENPDPCAGFEIEIHHTPIAHLEMPLAPLLEKADASDADDNADDCPVFFTQSALRSAERCSRRGAQLDPPVETGGVLAGSLCASPCGEFFVVVTDVLEATDALQTPYSLGFTDHTWSRIQQVVRARQQRHPQRAFRLLGNCHGHNFLPNLVPSANDSGSCHSCDKRETCSLTSVFVSEDDQNWSKAVFARQPWHLMHIFGLTARGEPVHKLFGLRDGRLQARGFYLLPRFPL
jgi:hypothetical protein